MKVHNGTQRDAVLFSVGANADHGLRRTNEDKRRAVLTLLKDAEWGSRSDRWIAEKCGVAHSFVADRRAELESDSSSPAHRTGKEGKTRKAPSRPTESKPSKPSKGQLTEEQRKDIRAQIEGKILDGRNRARACELAGVEPKTEEWDGRQGSPVAFVLSENLHRRHLSPSQVASIAAESTALFEVEARERQKSTRFGSAVPANLQEPGEAAELAAALCGVSPRSVYSALKVKEKGTPALAQVIAQALHQEQVAALRQEDEVGAARLARLAESTKFVD